MSKSRSRRREGAVYVQCTLYIYIICTLKLSSSRIFVTNEIAAAPCCYIYIYERKGSGILGYSDFTCRYVLYSISTFDAAKYNIFDDITLYVYLSGVAKEGAWMVRCLTPFPPLTFPS